MLARSVRRFAGAAIAAGLLVLPSDAHALSSCTYMAVAQAAATGGVHRLDCDGTISFPEPILIPAGRDVRLTRPARR